MRRNDAPVSLPNPFRSGNPPFCFKRQWVPFEPVRLFALQCCSSVTCFFPTYQASWTYEGRAFDIHELWISIILAPPGLLPEIWSWFDRGWGGFCLLGWVSMSGTSATWEWHSGDRRILNEHTGSPNMFAWSPCTASGTQASSGSLNTRSQANWCL